MYIFAIDILIIISGENSTILYCLGEIGALDEIFIAYLIRKLHKILKNHDREVVIFCYYPAKSKSPSIKRNSVSGSPFSSPER